MPETHARQKEVDAPQPDSLALQLSSLRRQRRLLVILCLLQCGVIALLVLWQPSPAVPQPKRRGSGSSPDREPFFVGHPGPWGELEFARINIEPPDDFLPPSDRTFEPTRWLFEGWSPAQLQELLDRCELTVMQRAVLTNRTAWQVESNGVALTPGADLILSLSPQARTELYRVLGHSMRNEFHYWPYTYRGSGLHEWFGRSGLSPSTSEWLNKLVYPRGGALCFSDLPELSARIPDLAERQHLLKTLFRNSALLMKLRIRPDTDIAALQAYWGRNGRAKDFRPLLESLQHAGGNITLDISHLLPPFARKHLNTYPSPPHLSQQVADCYWTALNFFNDPPDDRYYDEAAWSQDLREKYALIDEPGFGDLVFLLLPDGTPIHAAVYIADKVVFTKNGGHLRQPWLLMEMEDMLARYPTDQGVHLVYFRLKD